MSNVVTQNPEVLGGEPVFAGTRCAGLKEASSHHLEAGDSIQSSFLKAFRA